MIQLFAPYPDYSILITLPDPEWGDMQRVESTMQLKRSMNGVTTVTHVRKLTNVRSYEINLLLTRPKSLEFLSFFSLFGSEKMRLILTDTTEKIGFIRINPIELEITKRSIVGTSKEEVSVRFDFESIL